MVECIAPVLSTGLLPKADDLEKSKGGDARNQGHWARQPEQQQQQPHNHSTNAMTSQISSGSGLTMDACGPMHGMGTTAGFKAFAPAGGARRGPSDEAKVCTVVAASALFLAALSSAIEPQYYRGHGDEYHSGGEFGSDQRQHDRLEVAKAPAAAPGGGLVLPALAAALLLVLGVATAVLRRRASAALLRETKKLAEAEAYRKTELLKLRQARLVREQQVADAKLETVRLRAAAVTLQRGWREGKERTRTVHLSDGHAEARRRLQAKQDEQSRDAAAKKTRRSLRSAAAGCAKQQWSSHSLDLPPRFAPCGDAMARPTLRLQEAATVGSTEGQALLDTGNSGHTLIRRSFARSVDLIDESGLPRMLSGSAVRHVTVRGVVADAEEECVLIPAVVFSIGGLEVRSDILVTENERLGCDLLVSIDDIDKLVAQGADFQPTRSEVLPEVKHTPVSGFDRPGVRLGAAGEAASVQPHLSAAELRARRVEKMSRVSAMSSRGDVG
jgi:hypothetical protein